MACLWQSTRVHGMSPAVHTWVNDVRCQLQTSKSYPSTVCVCCWGWLASFVLARRTRSVATTWWKKSQILSGLTTRMASNAERLASASKMNEKKRLVIADHFVYMPTIGCFESSSYCCCIRLSIVGKCWAWFSDAKKKPQNKMWCQQRTWKIIISLPFSWKKLHSFIKFT